MAGDQFVPSATATTYDNRLQELVLGDACGELLYTLQPVPRVAGTQANPSHGDQVDDAVVDRWDRDGRYLEVGEGGPTFDD